MDFVDSGGFCVLYGVFLGSSQLFVFFGFGVSVCSLTSSSKNENMNTFRQVMSFSLHCSLPQLPISPTTVCGLNYLSRPWKHSSPPQAKAALS